MVQVDKRSHLVLFKQNQRNRDPYTSELQKAYKTDYLANRHNMMGTVSKLYVSNNTWIYVYIKKLYKISTPIPTPESFNSNSNSNSGSFNSNSNSNSGKSLEYQLQLQLQLQLQEFQLQLQLRPISRISTPTPTPEVSTPIPTPTPELELELNPTPTPTPELTPTLNEEQCFHCFQLCLYICIYIYFDVSQYDNTSFLFTLSSHLKQWLIFCKVLVLSFYINVYPCFLFKDMTNRRGPIRYIQ